MSDSLIDEDAPTSVRYPIRVLMIGPAPAGPNSRGGMATVMRLMLEDPDPRFVIRVVPTWFNLPFIPRFWAGIKGMLTAAALVLLRRVDVLHVHHSKGGSVVRKSVPLWAARLRGVPAIVHCHSSRFFVWVDRMPWLVRRAVRAALHADYCVVLGQSHVDGSRRCLGLDDTNIRVLYNPVVMPAAAPRPCSPRPVRAVALGQLGTNKGTYDLVRAIALLSDDIRANLSITIAGDGEVEQAREFVRLHGLTDAIDIVGWVDPNTRDRLLTESQIFVLPSHSEGLPMAMLEAMAHGLVPLTTPVGAIPEVVTDRVDGVLVPPGDTEQLAVALRSLVVDDELRNSLGQAAYVRAAKFDIAQWRAELRKLWISAAASRSS
jgi:glycosyltransferase involved in cell wall biosynthesis